MSIRITLIREREATLVRVAGRLKVEDLNEWARTLQNVSGPIALDLSDLQSADRPSVAHIRESIASGAELRAASPYVELLLQSTTERERR